MKLLLAAATAVALLTVSHASLGAFALSGARWPDGSITMRVQLGSPSGSLIDGAGSWNAVGEAALAAWNEHLSGAQFRITTASGRSGERNGVNDVTWEDDAFGEPFGDALAITYFRGRGSSIIEADVIFDRNERWNSYRGNLRNSGGRRLWDLRRVAIHEFGHVLGLDHPDEEGQSVAAIMNSHIGHLDGLQADDISGIHASYGAPARDRLASGARLTAGQALVSPNARFRLVYQVDGNLVLYDDTARTYVWTTATAGSTAGQLVMQGDGNLVVYDAAGRPAWFSATSGNTGAILALQNDGNLVVYRSGQAVWDRISHP
jgi:hypothetical protein